VAVPKRCLRAAAVARRMRAWHLSVPRAGDERFSTRVPTAHRRMPPLGRDQLPEGVIIVVMMVVVVVWVVLAVAVVGGGQVQRCHKLPLWLGDRIRALMRRGHHLLVRSGWDRRLVFLLGRSIQGYHRLLLLSDEQSQALLLVLSERGRCLVFLLRSRLALR